MTGFKETRVRIGSLLGLALVVGVFASPALSAGEDTQTPACKKGEIYDKKTKKCVKRTSESLSDESRTDYAYTLAKAERYAEALEVLGTLRGPPSAEALNYKGFATRKLGRAEEGIGYYLQSVALDPRYAKVREYLGEAYVEQGQRKLAEEQLVAIETICGRNCEEYRDLAEALNTP